MSTQKITPNHELLHCLETSMKARREGGAPAYSAPADASREDKAIHLFRMARSKFPYQVCPLTYVVWVIDNSRTRPPETANSVQSVKSLLKSRRVKDALEKRSQRIFYVGGKGKSAGYRMNVDDDDTAMAVLSTEKLRARNALHRAAQTHTMIDESKLTLPAAREEYEEVGAMVGVLSQAGFLTLTNLPHDTLKRLQAGIARRKKRAA